MGPMKRSVLIAAAVAVSLTPSAPQAQDSCDCVTSVKTSVLGDSRYEVITLPAQAQNYRLDKFTGEVWNLQRSGSRFTSMTLAWKALPPPPGEEGRATARVNYQLTIAGSSSPLLMNVHTGASWTLRTAAGDVKWEAIAIEK